MSVELDNVGHKFAASPWLFRHLSAVRFWQINPAVADRGMGNSSRGYDQRPPSVW